jgi:hypothetical protein
MNRILPFVILCAWAAHAAAAAPTCAAQAKERKLTGAAQSSFMKKCEAEAAAACEAKAKEKKLAGAARDSFQKKCVAEATGAG